MLDEGRLHRWCSDSLPVTSRAEIRREAGLRPSAVLSSTAPTLSSPCGATAASGSDHVVVVVLVLEVVGAEVVGGAVVVEGEVDLVVGVEVWLTDCDCVDCAPVLLFAVIM